MKNKYSNRIVTTALATIALTILSVVSSQARGVGTISLTFNPSANTDTGRYFFRSPNVPNFDRNEKTYVLIHGFQGNQNTLGDVRTALETEQRTANIITVDWSSISGNNWDQYSWVYNRMWHVGWNLADVLRTNFQIDPSKTELIGFSLGAHVAGATGHRYFRDNHKKISRIIGLDAAGYSLSHLGSDVRLDKGDAVKVIGIHSSDATHFAISGDGGTIINSEAEGWGKEYGDLDIYIYTLLAPNAKGLGQLLGSGAGNWRNDHDYANRVFIDLINGESFLYANKWTWGEHDFRGAFNLGSLDSEKATVTIWHR